MKEELFKQLISEQEAIVEQLEKAQKRETSDADLEEGATIDPDDQSHQTQSTDMATFYEDMQGDNKAMILELKSTMTLTKSVVEHGALVETENLLFVIGIPVTSTSFQGRKVVGVSPRSPVFLQNENRTSADHFLLNERSLVIISIS